MVCEPTSPLPTSHQPVAQQQGSAAACQTVGEEAKSDDVMPAQHERLMSGEVPRSEPDADESPSDTADERSTSAAQTSVETSGGRPTDPQPATDGVVVVGIGASAGGLSALKSLLGDIAPDGRSAYVVVVHLSPQHESHLAELLQPSVALPVQQVTETVPLLADRVYVIPPNRNLTAVDTHLRLSPLEEQRSRRAPVDHFLRTLASTHDGHAVAVVLTGTGSDGALGLKEVKQRGGLTIVQDPVDAEFDGMPRAAISTGLVDLVLPLREIPRSIKRYTSTEPALRLPDDGGQLDADQSQLLQRLFGQLRARTGRDFSHYKRSTIVRRIRRRMQMATIEDFETYVERVRDDPAEARALADDLLITVSSFFRDPSVFASLESEVIPGLFEGKGPNDEIRIWSVGCATGEEAYSLAMLLLEESERHDDPPSVRIFATDLHEPSLARAREGLYTGDIDADVPAARLRRFFKPTNGSYRIRDEVREIVTFASHNVLGDPPFSRLDLVSCRNLLIYLQRSVQFEVLQVFHYGLRPHGWLMIGSSETIEPSDQFRAAEPHRGLFTSRNVASGEPRLPHLPLARPRPATPPRVASGPSVPIALEDIHRRLIEERAAPSALVGPDDRVLRLSPGAGRYLVLPAGELTASIFKLARPELVIELRAGLYRARSDHQPWHSGPIRFESDGTTEHVVVHVHPSQVGDADGFSMVTFEPAAASAPPPAGADAAGSLAATRLSDAEGERDVARQHLQAIIEEYETSQEELRASNEEMQSSNEELRSTLEELETSKEELQSMNEELQTVNQENRHKVEELAQMSSDLQNLLSATDIATLFLDRELRILRFTPSVGELFNVLATDRGRPLSDISTRLGYAELDADARRVLRHLAPIERELRDERGRWYLTRMLAYRSPDDRIEGVVITFVDITSLKSAEDGLREAHDTLEERVEEGTRQVRELAARLTVAEQEARKRIAQVLHDDLQQQLYGIRTKLSFVADELNGGSIAEAQAILGEVDTLLDESVDITRHLTVDLSPPLLSSDGLTEALSWLVPHMADLHGLEVELEIEAPPDVEDEHLRTLLFQVTRELLFNVAKHSGAELARVHVETIGDEIVLTVSDQGRGFNFDHVETMRPNGLGLSNIRERLRLAGGNVSIQTVLGSGTIVEVRAPIDGDPPDPSEHDPSGGATA
jgi:two-component system CheB/CheR fusion protein